MEDLTGKQLGSYQVIAPLGEGGMAAVYKAFQPGMDRYVALKILPRQLATDPEFVGRFRQEAKLIASLQHPHILPIFDFGEADGYTYIVMPFVESGTLSGLLKGQPLPLQQIRSIISQVGDALDYAHSRGLVHRDVKPSNVLVDARLNCLLTDFGIARMVEGTSKFTATGGVLGTPSYMSPEQGMGEKVDQRSDIYSLGVMLYEMATGRVPYQAETPIAVVIKHIHDPLPPPYTVNPALPETLERVILKSLAKRPDDRYATAGDLVRALQQAIAEPTQPQVAASDTIAKQSVRTIPEKAPVPAPPASIQLAPWPRQLLRWAWIVSGAVVLVAVVALLVLAGGPRVPVATLIPTAVPAAPTAPPASPTRVPPTATATAVPPLTGGGTGWIAYTSQARGNPDVFLVRVDGSEVRSLTDNPAKDLPSAWSPDGKQLAFVSDRDGNSDVFVMNADGSDQVNLTNNPAYDDRPAWSPDGARLAFYSNREGNQVDIFVMNTDGSQLVNLTNNPAADYDPAWSPDGARIAFTSERDGNREIYVMDADGSNQMNVTNHSSADKFPSWSADSSQIVFESEREGNYEIYAMKADGSNLVNLTKHAANDRWPAWSPDGSLIAFDSDRDGNREIYVMKADGSEPVRLTDVSGLEFGPTWQPLPGAIGATATGQKIGMVIDTGGENDWSLTSTR
jgi:Tol biopolymer transport system component